MFAGLVAAGVLMVPLLEHYAAAGLLLTAVVLFVLFYVGQLRANPLTTVLVLAFTLIPVAGVLEQALIGGSQPDAGGRRARRGGGQRGIERHLSRSAGACFRGRGGTRPTARARAGSPGAAR